MLLVSARLTVLLLLLFPLFLPATETSPRNPKAGTNTLQPQNPAESDLVELASGEHVEGAILNQDFELKTSYGDIQFKRQDLARIDFSDPDRQLQRVITVNSNILTGFLTNKTIDFQTGDGIRRNFHPQKLLDLRLDGNAGRTPKAAHRIWVWLRNGDRLSGQLLTQSLALITAQGTELFSFREINRVQCGPTDSAVAAVLLMNGQKRQGTLATEDLSLRLELGPTVQVYSGAIELIGIDLGAQPKPPISAASTAPPPATSTTSNELAGFVWIPPGEFLMGSPTEETGRDPDESPQTHVMMRRGYWMGKCEVTQSEYQKVMGNNPSNETGDANRPVERVNWFDALEYCKKLTQACETAGKLPEGYAYRLPTEAEWEYACRAGSMTRFSYGEDKSATQLSEYAWFNRNSDSMTHPIATKQPNRWGLFDMHGNVWEWCIDRWEDSLPGGTITNSVRVATGRLRVARGGSWLYDAKASRSANRDDYSPWDRCSDIGFRVVLAPIQP
jgi:formylglycine-generating enzyme required for sulfatase activity